jgi:hypothetical protein
MLNIFKWDFIEWQNIEQFYRLNLDQLDAKPKCNLINSELYLQMLINLIGIITVILYK